MQQTPRQVRENLNALPQNSLFDQIEIYLMVLLIRKWMAILPILFCVSIAMVWAFFAPKYYKSSTLILIEPQQVPDSYVKQTDTTPIESRLNTLRQQIMSRTKQEQIIKEFDPYKEIPAKGLLKTYEVILKEIKNLFSKIPGLENRLNKKKQSMEDMVEKMRKDIEINVVGGGGKGAAFTISFIGRDPYKTMQVTNSIASLYIEENLKIREQYAEGTSEFLTAELAKAKENLELQESAVKVFKEQYMGSLPGQLEANLRTLDRLQLDLQSVQANIRATAEGQRILEEQLRYAKEADLKVAVLSGETNEPVSSPEVALITLKQQLTSLLGIYKENYPDVVILKKRIKELEESLKKTEKNNTPSGDETSEPELNFRGNSELAKINNRILSENFKMKSLLKSEAEIKKQISIYEKRVEDTPANEQKLADIVRDYDMSNRNYASLLEKKLNASLAENMEKRQKGERFRVLDPANLPEKPFKPNKLTILLIGIAAGIISGGSLIYLYEFMNPPFRRPRDLEASFHMPVMASIPLFFGQNRKQKKNGNEIKKLPGFEKTANLDPIILEQYYILVTKLEQINFKHSYKSFAVTSAVKGEGKSTTSLNIAYAISQEFAKKVVLIECDFKKPSFMTYIPEAANQSGIIDVLQGNSSLDDAIFKIEDSNISILPALRTEKKSIQLLDSPEFAKIIDVLKTRFEYVILDTPPILSLADMNIISKKVDGILLVIKAGRTSKDIVLKAAASLNENITGLIFNGVDAMLSKDYYNYYG